jgi:CRISPR/Cas system CMR subunit Cmr6 (Cas7 group RAMP superfamily)
MPGYNLQQAQPAGFFAGHELKSLLEDGRKLESMSLRLDKFSDPRGRNKKANIESALALQGRAIHRSPLAIPGSVQVEMKLKSRLIVNQAGGILENAGLCIHKHFNCPYVPGSAVKGVSRRMAFQNIFDASTIDEKVDLVCKPLLSLVGETWLGVMEEQDGEFHPISNSPLVLTLLRFVLRRLHNSQN